MSSPSVPEPTVAQQLIVVVAELRRYLLLLGGALLATTFVFYCFATRLFHLLQTHLQQKLVFFAVTEPFLAHVKLALAAAIFVLLPLLATCFWSALAKPFGLSKANIFWFVLCSTLLFYSGAIFCFAITLPFGINYLLGYQSAQLKAYISIEQFVTFITLFVLGFGLIFELPMFMVFSSKVGICPRRKFEEYRRYAALAICVIAAILTPTPDMVNMALMGVPLYLLYELGIIIIKIMKI